MFVIFTFRRNKKRLTLETYST